MLTLTQPTAARTCVVASVELPRPGRGLTRFVAALLTALSALSV